MHDDDAHAGALRQLLQGEHPGLQVDWVERTGSTNADLLQWARTQTRASAPCLLVAGHQSAGRGRQGRRWHADVDTGLLCSLAWPLPPRCAVSGLSLAVGAWLGLALQQLGCAGVRLKWPNDLLLDGAKLGGVLIELADAPAARWAVVGVGLNLRAPQALDGAASLARCLPGVTRWSLLQTLAPALLDGLRHWPQQGFAPWAQAWNTLHAWAGQAVELTDAGRLQDRGIARGVDADGCLLLDTDTGTRRIASGDLSLRRADTAATPRR